MKVAALALVAALADASGTGPRICLNDTNQFDATEGYYTTPMTRNYTSATVGGWVDAVYTYPNSSSNLGVDLYMFQINTAAVGDSSQVWIGAALQILGPALMPAPVGAFTPVVDGLCSTGTGNVTAIIGNLDNPSSRTNGLDCASVQAGHQESSNKGYSDLLLTYVAPPGLDVSSFSLAYLVLNGATKAGGADSDAQTALKQAQTFVSGSIALSGAVEPPITALQRFVDEQCTAVTGCPAFSIEFTAACALVQQVIDDANPTSASASLVASFAAVAFATLF